MARDDFAIAHVPQRPIHKVGVDVGHRQRVIGQPTAREELDARVLVRQDVCVAVLLSDLLVVEEHRVLDLGVCAGSQRHELSFELSHAPPLRQRKRFFEIHAYFVLDPFPDRVGHIFSVAGPVDSGCFCWHSLEFLLEQLPNSFGVLLHFLHPD